MDSATVVAASLSGGGTLNFGTLDVGSDNTTTAFTGPINGNAITKVGTGRLTLAGAMTLIGTTTITAGTVRFGDGVTAPANIAGPIVVTGALEFNATTGTMLGGGVSGTGSLTVLGGPVASAGPFFAHTGPTTVNAGGVLAGAFSGLGSLTIAAGGQVDADNSGFSTLSGAGTFNVERRARLPRRHHQPEFDFTGSVGGPSTLSKLGYRHAHAFGHDTNAGRGRRRPGDAHPHGDDIGSGCDVFPGATSAGRGDRGR